MRVAVVEFINKKRGRIKIENVAEVGEGQNFIHIFLTGKDGVQEVNFRSHDVRSISIIEVPEDMPPPPMLVDESGNPIGDEAQVEEQLPVEQKDAGATPVVPAISENQMSDDDEIRHQQSAGVV